MNIKALVELAAEAYIYGYPMVYTIEEQIKHVNGEHPLPARPVNVMGYSDSLLGPEVHFVSPNNDTCYMSLDGDVTQEPLVLHVPDTGDRYYVLQFIDAWTNNFAYIGSRATGNKEGLFLLAGPDWQGDVPKGVTLVRAPTNIFHMVGRYAVSGEADVPEAGNCGSELYSSIQPTNTPRKAVNSGSHKSGLRHRRIAAIGRNNMSELKTMIVNKSCADMQPPITDERQ